MKTTIGTIEFPNPIFNASGVMCTTKADLSKLITAGVGGIWTKTQTIRPREGNLHPRVAVLTKPGNQVVSGNSVGLANGGCENMLEIVTELIPETFDNVSVRPVVLSVGGPYLHEIIQMIELAKDNPYVSGIEINPSCPNLEGKFQIAFDPDTFRELLTLVRATGITKPIGLKLPYYPGLSQIVWVTALLKEFQDIIKFITCINGMSGLLLNPKTDRAYTIPNYGITGLGGDLMLPFALQQIAMFYREFKVHNIKIDIIGCGGGTNPEAIWQMIWVGAKGVQIGTKLLQAGASQKADDLVTELLVGLIELMEKKREIHNREFTCINDVVGGYYFEQTNG